MVDLDLAGEARVFEPVARAVEAITPRLVVDRPGLLAFPTRGPSRYHGGDAALVVKVADAVRAVGVDDVRIGIADGGFAARLAARRAVSVAAGETPAFLAPWPIGAIADEDLADLLARLGLRTLGTYAVLPAGSVLARFGREGLAAHRLANGQDAHPPALTTPPPDFEERAELDPPAERIDEVAFVAKGMADRLLERLAARGLVCTQVIVEAETEHGETLARAWRHEGALTPGALAERVRWQLDGWLQSTGGLTGGLIGLRLVPEQVIPASGRQLGFWGGDAAAADRAARVLARVQGMLGPEHVVTAVPQGGRTPIERVRWVPWSEPREPGPHAPIGPVAGPVAVETPPWPGTIPGPAPARVLDPPVPAALGGPPRPSDRGLRPRRGLGRTGLPAQRCLARRGWGSHRLGRALAPGPAVVGSLDAGPARCLAGRGGGADGLSRPRRARPRDAHRALRLTVVEPWDGSVR